MQKIINWKNVILVVIGGVFGYILGVVSMFYVINGVLPWQ